MILKHLTDDQLLTDTVQAAANERLATTRLLHHLSEVQRRRLFAKVGCNSLFDYCVRELKMSSSQAARRVNSARLLREFPQIDELIQDGSLNVTTLSQAQTFFKAEKVDPAARLEVLNEIVGKSARDTEKYLLSVSTRPEAPIKESVKPVSPSMNQVTFAADEETIENLRRLQEIWSQTESGSNFGKVIKRIAKFCREKFDPDFKAAIAGSGEAGVGEHMPAVLESDASLRSAPNQITNSRYIPRAVRRQVWRRDRGRCTYVDLQSGRECGSKHKLQLDHIIPFGRGGQNLPDNLRLRCFAHNQWHAIESYGDKVLRHTQK